MHTLKITIDKFVDHTFPGWVECSLTDAHGKKHLFKEKIPVVSDRNLTDKNDYPTEGFVRCTLKAISPGGPDAEVVVNTRDIDGVESIEGENSFTVKYQQVCNSDSKCSE